VTTKGILLQQLSYIEFDCSRKQMQMLLGNVSLLIEDIACVAK